MKKKLFGLLSMAMVICLLLASCGEGGCPHIFEDACDDDCEICDYERTAHHVFDDGDCYTARRCVNCDEIDGDPLGHNVRFVRGADEDAKLCDRCHMFVHPDGTIPPYHE